jgi:nucleoid DNA-binding protein
MNKAEFINSVAERAGLSKADAERAVNAMIDTTVDTVAAGDSLTLPGFGTYTPRARQARKGRNPQTGAEIDIAASNSVGFKVGKSFKDKLNGK